ncbi:hypothetical protein BDQ17DRAFT_684853 [Cyathus striatus]|nr:hypothetical protein BDQ17DRAFT_684853 [Cyathus striatus]
MAPPVRRDGFSYYEGVFYAHIDNCRHERSNAETLHNLLTYEAPGPTLTKAGKIAKRQPEAHKDPPCHFYRAQLMHYGLPGLKAKQPAKKRLLAAIKDGSDGKTLEVPHDILKLENEMKEEWIKLKEAEVKKRKEEKASEEAAEKARNAERTRAIVQETVREHEEESMDDENESMNDEDESMDEEDKSTDEDDGLTEDEGNGSMDEDNESDAIPAYVIETRMGFFSLEKGIAEKLLDDVLNRNQSTEYDLRYGLEKLGVLKKGRMFNFTEYPEGVPLKEASSGKRNSLGGGRRDLLV